MKIKIQYTDGANYKYTAKFPFSTEQLQAISERYGKAVDPGTEIEYDRDLGISRAEFHEAIGSAYDPDFDHTFVAVVGITVDDYPGETEHLFKERQIRGMVEKALDESYHTMLSKIKKALQSGAVDIDSWSDKKESWILPRIIATAIMESEASEWAAKGSGYEKRIRKEVNNLKKFL